MKLKSTFGLLATFLVLTFSALLVGCGPSSNFSTITQQNLDKIQTDMTPDQVASILGQPTSSNSEPIPLVGGTKTTNFYSSGSSSIILVFKNNLMKEKTGNFQ